MSKLTKIQQTVLEFAQQILSDGEGVGYEGRMVAESQFWGVRHPTTGRPLSDGRIRASLQSLIKKGRLRHEVQGTFIPVRYYGLPISPAERLLELQAQQQDAEQNAHKALTSALAASNVSAAQQYLRDADRHAIRAVRLRIKAEKLRAEME